MTKIFLVLWLMHTTKDTAAILGASVFLLQLVFFFRETLGLSDFFSPHHVAIASTMCNQEEIWCGLFVTPLFYTSLRIIESATMLLASLI